MENTELKLKIEREKTRRAKITQKTVFVLESVASKWAIILGSFLLFLLFLALLVINL